LRSIRFSKIAPRGFEPLKENQQPTTNKELTKTENPVFDTSLDILLQKYPKLEQIITAWPELPEHTKAAVKSLVDSANYKEKTK